MADMADVNNYYDFSNSTLTIQSILDVFVLQDLISQTDAQKLKEKLKTNRKIEEFLIKNRVVSKDTINKAYSIILKLPYVETKNIILSEELKRIIPEKLVKQYGIIPFDLSSGIVKIAISRPADLLVGYRDSLGKIFAEKKLEIELFITGETDFLEVSKQYSPRYKSDGRSSKDGLPVVYLRNQSIPGSFLNKIPRDFIVKYRIVVFGQNQRGHYLIACEQPNSATTKKILDFIHTQNEIDFEIFATSKEDIDAILGIKAAKVTEKPFDSAQGRQSDGETERGAQPPVRDSAPSVSGGKSLIENLLDSFSGSNEPELTIDSIEAAPTNEQASQVVESRPADGTEAVAPASKAVKIATFAGPEPAEAQSAEPIAVAPNPVSPSVEKIKVPDMPKSETEQTAENAAADNASFDSKNLGSFIDHDVKTDADLIETTKSNSVPKIVAAVIDFALNNRSSDIHVEPEAKILRIRCRVDGILRDVLKLPLTLHAPFVSRIKIMSKLKIDETRIPQDGRFDTIFKDREVDIRVSTLPTIHGEKIVMRILDKSQGILSLEDLGMQGSAFDKTMEAMAKPYGIILSTGPTGSGKSTTLYAVLNRISVPGVNIITLEDPVEYDIAGINQCQIKPEIGFTFASGLRSILRQDPNVVMVGEIRDAETAGMAVHAALTGHLVLSTLHTNDTAGTLPRLIDMGVEPFLVTSSINLILAQRLVRRICPKCREEVKVPQKLIEQIIEELKKIPANNVKDRELIPKELKLYHGRGCDECNNGFKGRVGIYEAMTLNSEIEDMAIAKKTANEIKEASIRDGMITMKQDGIIKAIMGLTTIDEVFQAVVSD